MSTSAQRANATTHHNLIDGAWVPSGSADLFEDRNPANTDEVVGVFQESTAADVTDAIDAARLAYELWRILPAPKRAELLFRAAQLIADRKEALARDVTREMGKVLDENARRRAGGDRHHLLHGRRRPAAARPHRAVGAA